MGSAGVHGAYDSIETGGVRVRAFCWMGDCSSWRFDAVSGCQPYAFSLAGFLSIEVTNVPMPRLRTSLFTLSLAFAVLTAAAPFGEMARAQESDAQELSNAQLLKDFDHFVFIRSDELAEAYAQAILARGISPTEFVGLIEDDPKESERFQNAIRQAMLAPMLEEVAGELFNLYERGRLDRARNADEIARNIQLLGGNPRARMLATDRLREAGEFAVPQLLEVLLARRNQPLESQVERLLVNMGGDAVNPLAASLFDVDAITKSRLALMLGRTGRSEALPYLTDLYATTDDSAVREAAAQGIRLIAGYEPRPEMVAELYTQLGEQYYGHSKGLTRFRDETHQLLWNYDPGVGLLMTPIRTEVFHEAKTMELAERAMARDAEHEEAIALWLAANFSREIDHPEGYENPVYPASRPDALFYAVMAGAESTQRVLARSLEDRDSPLARRAIEALSRTAGDSSLWEGQGASRPLLDALAFPERRVQYDAAIALGKAKPNRPFPGAERIAPILAGAVRDASQRFALVITQDIERQQELSELLQKAGYQVPRAGRSLHDVQAAIADSPGIDLIVVELATDSTEGLLESARQMQKLQATPILALLPQTGWNKLWPRYETNTLTDVARAGLTREQLAARIGQLVSTASGDPVSESEAREYALASLDVLHDLAISRNSVIDVADAATPLMTALGDQSGDVKLRIADVLARMRKPEAQRALMDAAMKATGSVRVALLDRVTESARGFGNMLTDRQVSDLIELTTKSAGREATAGAALIGALNLSEQQLVPLILASEK